MTKTAALSIRIEPELKAALERLAEADKRSLASYAELALQDHVERQKRSKPKG
jgi:predicted transcriptional regulator